MIDYEVLRFIWWLLIGILLIGFAVADGFDMGVGMLTRFLGRNDTERRIMINAIAPIQIYLSPVHSRFQSKVKPCQGKVTNTLTKNPIDSPIYYATITLQ